jgi:hypothetical protein
MKLQPRFLQKKKAKEGKEKDILSEHSSCGSDSNLHLMNYNVNTFLLH